MPDVEKVEKVINGLEDSLANNGCGFMDGVGELFAVSGEDLQNAIALLKAQETVTVIPAIKKNDELLTEGSCPICGAKLDYYLNGQFCGCCGRRLKWE